MGKPTNSEARGFLDRMVPGTPFGTTRFHELKGNIELIEKMHSPLNLEKTFRK